MGLRNLRPKLVTALKAPHGLHRLKRTHEHRNWTIDEWKKVAWSDKSSFLVHHIDEHARMHRFATKTPATECIVSRRHACGGYINVWAMFLWRRAH